VPENLNRLIELLNLQWLLQNRDRADLKNPIEDLAVRVTCDQFSNNVVSFSRNLVLKSLLFSINVVRTWAIFLGQAIYVLGPLAWSSLGGRYPHDDSDRFRGVRKKRTRPIHLYYICSDGLMRSQRNS